ncbi:S1 family peptidase [Streptomyces cylindrosporus]|uniref:S1 family peptidase n=1 Tax=Streptomyces cylindrosporus TaxID=2927583 RepID=A0ABS9Y973_9ACTN|nr:S1 family peptidase [Streptomyces cylindrosporus]MCI3273509.1 S1 family peptidase [Streptomyces cylindrosporus]
MRSARRSKRLALALVGTLAVARATLTVSTPAWAGSSATQASASTELSQHDWTQLGKIQAQHSVLGIADTGAVLRLPAGASAGEKAKVEAQLPADAHTVVRTSRFSQSQLDRIQKTATARDWNSDADKYGLATTYDATTDKVIINTDAPASVTRALAEKYPGALEVRQARLESQRTRFGDAQPFWGGDALIGSEGSGAASCTAGFAVKQKATGHLYMTTAGHCYGLNTHVYSRGQNNGWGNWVGQVTRRNRDIDTELIQNTLTSAGYDSFIFTGGLASSGATHFVHGTESPSVSRKVCVSGSVSFNHCGHPISNTSYSICYSGGIDCIKNGQGFLYDRGGTYPTYNNGKLTQGGDSGAPIYTTDDTDSAAWIVGGHSGLIYTSSGACSCSVPHMVGVSEYAIVNNLGVSVLTR